MVLMGTGTTDKPEQKLEASTELGTIKPVSIEQPVSAETNAECTEVVCAEVVCNEVRIF